MPPVSGKKEFEFPALCSFIPTRKNVGGEKLHAAAPLLRIELALKYNSSFEK